MGTRNIENPLKCPPKLNLDVRLMIWRLSYEIEPSRIVEV